MSSSFVSTKKKHLLEDPGVGKYGTYNIKLSHYICLKSYYFTNLDFPEIAGVPISLEKTRLFRRWSFFSPDFPVDLMEKLPGSNKHIWPKMSGFARSEMILQMEVTFSALKRSLVGRKMSFFSTWL